MLVLSRKIGERIVIPQCELEFLVLEVKGKRVRLGVTVPAKVDVYREEVWRQLCQEKHSHPPLG